ncbi:hypothetical protein BK764_12400 [Bacillus thuringiensis serovar israelensis]|uniref:Cysteine-rich protein n=3 Tax=Bacillus thuringiensis TaxID=1428 RepID=A0A0B5NJR0_BACTU|nr:MULTISPECIES: hypothetical protein [Bacillus]AJH03034.1 hypothetical protein AS86_6188 [Bacillus thuringiensis HD1002]EAO52854.1 Cysteine-rich protein [Bacillus thuringiensis serovar israelensis ATCC 35646]EEM99918.1 hypothetical protein bthur0014_54140 [Bacillus thuringiensis IBL 4222]KRD80839.1 hypothetical protein ASE53_17460 [Bacillus sp. Root11]KRD85370.1 hypothetical protein ASE54_17465 [Bacillus sp. Root131]MEC3431580.1 hypothetical protein [Bacillus cereus]MED1153597.1 hypothetica
MCTEQCKTEGCQEKVIADGYCYIHFMSVSSKTKDKSQKAKETIIENYAITCMEQGCEQIKTYKDRCDKHTTLHYLQEKVQICKINGCLNEVHQDELCKYHSRQKEVLGFTIETVPTVRLCKEVGCLHDGVYRQYCKKHYIEHKREEDVGKDLFCKEEQCSEIAEIKGYCLNHYKSEGKQVKGKDKTPKVVVTLEMSNRCGIKDCTKVLFDEDFCEKHANLINSQVSVDESFNNTGFDKKSIQTCIVDGCVHLEHKFGLCEYHYNDISELGDFKSDKEVFEDRRCAVEDCRSKRTKVIKDSCFCKSHYEEFVNREKIAKKIKKKTEKLCNVFECNEPRDTRLYCSYHAEHIKMGYDFEMKDWCSQTGCKEEANMMIGKKYYCKKHGTCKTRYCRNPVHQNGLCKEHVLQKQEEKQCKTMNCGEKAYRKGLCINHYTIAKNLERGV